MAHLGMVIPPAVGGLIIRFMFDDVVGIVPRVFAALGVEGRLAGSWLRYPETALFALILGSVWIWTGFSLTTYAAAMKAVPRSHIEAARVFGASELQILFRVVAPQVKPATLIVVVMTFLWDMKIFDVVWASTKGGPGGASNVLAVVMYLYFSRALDFGAAAAVAVLMTLVVAPAIAVYARLAGRG